MSHIIYEDSDILVAYKSAGMATESRKITEEDLYSFLMNYLKTKSRKNTAIHLINRLDQNVSGLVLCALNDRSAAILTKSLQEGKIDKIYKAKVTKEPKEKKGKLEGKLYFDKKENKSYMVKEGQRGYKEAKNAALTYEVIAPNELKIHLLTGRHHQIRCQLSHMGCTILGDYKYASPEEIKSFNEKGYKAIELKAYKLRFSHPTTGELMDIELKGEDDG